MAQLNREDTLKLAKVVVRALSKSKGAAIDHARAAIPNDRNFDQFAKFVKGNEQAVRTILFQTLAEIGIIEAIAEDELRTMK